ncbi:hypothetical protein HMPREF0666_00176 [Prevotella sp. C561]|nr:hypothetical protein HMPREF0666_00176 [Prevotella sp. C561]
MISYCLKAARGYNDRFAFVLLLLCLPFYPVLFYSFFLFGSSAIWSDTF